MANIFSIDQNSSNDGMIYEHTVLRVKIETSENWQHWAKAIPFLRFRNDWEVQIVPPVNDATTRFVIRKDDIYVSVYFDANSQLGYMYDDDGKPIPYFEAIATNGFEGRYLLNETDQMMDDIANALGETV